MVVVLVVVVLVVLLVTGVKQSQLLGLRLSLEFDKNGSAILRNGQVSQLIRCILGSLEKEEFD